MTRDEMLQNVRTALGRSAGQSPAEPPAVRLRIPEVSVDERIQEFSKALESLAGHVFRASSPEDAREYAVRLLAGKSAIASNSPLLRELGITGIDGVRSDVHEREELRGLCATADVGVTGADYALADTGSLVMISSQEEARLVSLLPPVHLAFLSKDRILTGLDELFTLLPVPAEKSSSMVLITGPSRTADIEQILIRGVHGPGEIHVVIV